MKVDVFKDFLCRMISCLRNSQQENHDQGKKQFRSHFVFVCIQSSQLKLKIQTDNNQTQSQLYLSGLQWYKLFTLNHLAYFFFSRPKYFVVGERYLVLLYYSVF